MTGDQTESERSAEDDSDVAWTTDSLAEERELVADRRDTAADDRDRDADSRDSAAQIRDSAADRRDLAADSGDDPDGAARQNLTAVGLRRDQAEARGVALRHRESVAARRAVAARLRAAEAERRRVSSRDDTRAVAAHLALNKSAAVVVAIEQLRDRWQQIDQTDRTLLIDIVHRNARSVDDALREMILGQPT